MDLLILPHAGGSAKTYCNMKKFFPTEIRLVPLEPSGRGARINEPFCESIEECASDLAERLVLSGESDGYAIFGHSMGTMLAAELVRQLRRRGVSGPEHVFLSGRCALDDKASLRFTASSTDEEITRFFVENELIPSAVVQNEQLFAMFSAILCADIRMTGDYRLTPKDFTFDCDISVLYGRSDKFLCGCDMKRWAAYTNGKCELFEFNGGHFYYSDEKEKLCGIITQKLLGI